MIVNEFEGCRPRTPYRIDLSCLLPSDLVEWLDAKQQPFGYTTLSP